jgi:proline iminopeptidase
MHVTSKTIPVSDIEVACTLVGDGPAVVVLHGAIGLGSAYTRALDPWGDELGLVYYDQRGSGHTPVGDPGKVTFAGAIEDLEGLRKALGLATMRLVGHSAGAHLAALYAGTHPETTSAVVLLNSGPPLDPRLMERFGAAMAARRTAADNEARRAIEESEQFRNLEPLALERHQLNTFIPFFRDRASIEHVALGFTEITAANVQAAPERMMGSIGVLDPMGTHAGIRCPALVVHSELDPIPNEWSLALVDTIPDADYVLIEGGSHFSLIEDADQLRGTVVPWLQKHTT